MILDEEEGFIEWDDKHPIEPDIHSAPGTWGPCCAWPKPTAKRRRNKGGSGEDGFFERMERREVHITSLSLHTGFDAITQIMREGKRGRTSHFGEWDKYE